MTKELTVEISTDETDALITEKMPAKVFKTGKTGWYVRDVVTISGKEYVLNFMLYEEVKK